MPREFSDSISFVVQAQFSDEGNSSQQSSAFDRSPSNLLESSDKYGFVFFCRGSILRAISVQLSENLLNGGDGSLPFHQDYSFEVEFDAGDISLISLSASESYIAIMSGTTLSILSVPDLLIEVRSTNHF